MKFKSELEKEFYYRSQIEHSYFELAQLLDTPESPQGSITEHAGKVQGLVSNIIKYKEQINCNTEADKKFLKDFNGHLLLN